MISVLCCQDGDESSSNPTVYSQCYSSRNGYYQHFGISSCYQMRLVLLLVAYFCIPLDGTSWKWIVRAHFSIFCNGQSCYQMRFVLLLVASLFIPLAELKFIISWWYEMQKAIVRFMLGPLIKKSGTKLYLTYLFLIIFFINQNLKSYKQLIAWNYQLQLLYWSRHRLTQNHEIRFVNVRVFNLEWTITAKRGG